MSLINYASLFKTQFDIRVNIVFLRPIENQYYIYLFVPNLSLFM